MGRKHIDFFITQCRMFAKEELLNSTLKAYKKGGVGFKLIETQIESFIINPALINTEEDLKQSKDERNWADIDPNISKKYTITFKHYREQKLKETSKSKKYSSDEMLSSSLGVFTDKELDIYKNVIACLNLNRLYFVNHMDEIK